MPLIVRPYTDDLKDLSADFNEASVLVMPSRAEGFALVVLEAISWGIPVVVGSGSGVAELLKEQLNLQPDDPTFLDASGVGGSPAELYSDNLIRYLDDTKWAYNSALIFRERLLKCCS